MKQSPGSPLSAPPSPAPEVRREIEATLTALLPWMTSALFHLGVVVLALLLVWASALREPPRSPVAASISPLASQPSLKSVSTPELPSDPARSAIDIPAPRPREPLVQPSDPLIGPVGPLTPTEAAEGIRGLGPPAGPRGTGMFDPPPPTPNEATPARIVYVIDASGSLVEEMDFVLQELTRSLEDLDAKQRFAVIFFQRDLAIELRPAGLRLATAAAKADMRAWLSPGAGRIRPGGTSNPLIALRRAFAYRPDLVFLLSDNITGRGRYELDRDDLLRQVAALNRGVAAPVHTIQFLYPDRLQTLREISARHGGSHRSVLAADLYGRER